MKDQVKHMYLSRIILVKTQGTKVPFPSALLPLPPREQSIFTAISLQTHFILSSHHRSSRCGFFRNRKSSAHAVQKDNEFESEFQPRKRLISCGRLLQQNST